ncbi:MAG: histidine kinase [Firmicutes bacterium]|nr:histidine kinase [Bacillota bacterium]
MLNSFLTIQQARFGKRLNIILDIEQGLDKVFIPGMLLQPLVENAIIHGIEINTQPGLIKVTIKRQGDKLCCRIKDNGIGFDTKAMGTKKQGIGLNSVKSRLQYYFNDEFDFRVVSQPEKGTSVELSFPIGGNENAQY